MEDRKPHERKFKNLRINAELFTEFGAWAYENHKSLPREIERALTEYLDRASAAEEAAQA